MQNVCTTHHCRNPAVAIVHFLAQVHKVEIMAQNASRGRLEVLALLGIGSDLADMAHINRVRWRLPAGLRCTGGHFSIERRGVERLTA